MRVLVVGSGGREHALCWKIAQSEKADKVYSAPGNGGISEIAECVDIKMDDIETVLKFAINNKIDLTVVGPEAALSKGIVDRFNSKGLRIFGPNKKAAQIESSKVFMKSLLKKYNIPTAPFEVFTDSASAKKYIKGIKGKFVIKADGLAAGKGVVVCSNIEEGLLAIEAFMDKKIFKEAGDRVIIEECLDGEEVSIIVVTDGKDAVSLASAQDHKRIYDADKGPNTGGMGAYSPAFAVSEALFGEITKTIIKPAIKAMSDEGICYKGALYAGLMLTSSGPKVLEFNCRFGDPETQAILPRLKSDIIELMDASIDNKIDLVSLEWDKRVCVTVVASSGGYPGDYKTGFEIEGLESLGKMKDIYVFHAGTKLIHSLRRRPQSPPEADQPLAGTVRRFVSDGGRVLNVTALGGTIKEAIDKCYDAVNLIGFEGMYFRRDIGYRALRRIQS